MSTEAHGDIDGEDFIPIGEAEEMIGKKIVHTLTIFPKLSASMLQVGIGTSLMPSLWRPVLERLIKEEIIERVSINAQTPHGRDQAYEVLQLKRHLPNFGTPIA